MKGILKIYHPEETLKYQIKHTYCKAIYSHNQHFLEVEIITDDSLDHVEDDSLQYRFPQIAFRVSDFPIVSAQLSEKTLEIDDSEEESYTEVDLFDDEEAFLYGNHLRFSEDEEGVLQLTWQGEIDDFYSGASEPIPFKLKCHFKPDQIEVDED
ncbi:hypothetical protein [Bergeyella sp. RCAD1439]|uniref:hypothetical protein n=1 Tax=Bergeyella anatis TaxID=3113737 RepID=UPI002E19B419|nr:hypothetical protein [Bergeyella sp. RCAD1439]